ncbi:MAG: TetR/AcrR family transcriptional regulator [Phycisphaerae bacterium]|nr:TetR/AcrR family transcriptional regulator [Phycisphaerae bacterium]
MDTVTTKHSTERKLTPKGEQRRKELLEKALELFGEKGFRATTVDDIVKAASTGKGTFYWYWKSKEDIFRELLTEKFQSYLIALEGVAELKMTAPERVLLIIAEVGNIFRKYRKFCKLVFLLISEDSENFNEDVLLTTRNYYKRFKEVIAKVLEDGKKEGTVSTQVDAEHFATIMVSILDGVIVQENALGAEFSITKLGETLLAVLKGGLFTLKDTKGG